MSSTATRLKNDQGVELFYYLKITGLPYYFFSVINPTDSKYGSAAWTLPTGYTAVQGMELPDDSITQSIGDIVGGIAEAEKIRVALRDFQVSSASGPVYFLSRLFAPGRQANSGAVPELETPIASTDEDTDVTIRNVPAAGLSTSTIAGTSGFIHIGAECILLDSVFPVTDGRCVVELRTRNKFPCATGFPPVPYHRVLGVAANLVSDPPVDLGISGANPRVTAEPTIMIGRTAALYIGHMTPHGKPCTEAEALCRLIGRVSSMDYGKGAGRYEIQIDSILADLKSASVAPGLGTFSIKPGQIVLTDARWRKIVFEKDKIDDSNDYIDTASKFFTIDDGGDNVYPTPQGLVNQINLTFQSVIGVGGLWADGLMPIAQLDTVDGHLRCSFHMVGTRASNIKTVFRVQNPRGIGDTPSVGLLTPLGFTSSEYEATVEPNAADIVAADAPVLTAESVAPSVFIPYGTNENPAEFTLSRNPSSLATEIFTDQGEGVAYARLGNGDIFSVVDTDLLNNRMSIGKRIISGALTSPHLRPVESATFYYTPQGSEATLEQVIVFPPDGSPVGADLDVGVIIGKLLASTPAGTVDATFNTLPDGVGLGWIDILDTDSFRKITTESVKRRFIIDQATKFGDIFSVLAKEYGWILCWDPEQSKVSIRKVFVPSAPVAHAVSFTESNRAQVNDRTNQRIDQSNLRTSWTLRWGWDQTSGKFLAPDMTVNDRYVQSSYGLVSAKAEKIEDKSLVMAAANSGFMVLSEVIRRSYMYRQPWLRCKRSLGKVGMLLAPGTSHQIIDSTIVNPFTGAIGVTSADRIYGMLMSVTSNLATGECDIEFTINQQDPAGLFRWFSPVALVDFNATSHGYNTSTGVLTLASEYASDGTSKDGIDFAVGDTVQLVERNWKDSGSNYSQTSTITAVASDGSTVTISSGLPAITTEVLMMLRGYANATTSRKTSVAFQGSFTGVIAATTDPNHRWL